MKKLFFSLANFTAFVFIIGCAAPYTPAPQILPSYVRKIAIRPFVNNTTQYGLEEKLTLQVINEFVRDGRLAVTNNESEADGIIVGEINKYILQPLTYDANLVTNQYKLWILLNVHFIDTKNNVTLWNEPNLEGIQIFYDSTQPGGQTEEEVRQTLWDNFAVDIVKRTYEGFGSVRSASEKKVPK
ncbi:MAG: LPS assembly lipoprotein LptE [Elusimicrobia bacterium]|nr:LPS assembly lipoprotein LptE [Candidatus Liberimonas magnetica]